MTEADALSLVVAQRLAGLDLLEQRVAVDLESDQVRVRALLGAARSSALVACRCRVGEAVGRCREATRTLCSLPALTLAHLAMVQSIGTNGKRCRG